MKAKVVEKAPAAAEAVETAAPVQPEMVRPVEGVTKSGFAFKYDADRMDDMELFEKFAAADKGDPAQAKAGLEMLLGEDGVKSLYAHLKAQEGRVRWSSFYRELVEIANYSPEGKNS